MKTQYKSHNFPEHFCPLQTIFLALNLSERFVGHQIWTCCSLYENGVQVLSFTILSSVTFVKNNNLFTCRVKNCQFETLFILCTKIYWNPTFCIQEHFQILYFIIVCSILMKRCKNSYLPINMLLENWWNFGISKRPREMSTNFRFCGLDLAVRITLDTPTYSYLFFLYNSFIRNLK